MANPHTTDFLVSSIKRRGMLPSNAGTFGTTDYLAIASEEQDTYIAELLVSLGEEHTVTSIDRTIVSGTASYDVPTRAIAAGLRDVLYVGSDGNEVSLTRLEPENKVEEVVTSGTPSAFMLQGNSVVLVPTPSSSGTLRLKYHRTFNRLVTTAECGTVTVIDRNANTVTVSGIPATFTSSVTYDMVRGTPHFDVLAMDLVASVAGSVLTFNFIPDSLVVGDFIALAGETCVPNFIKELHPVLACRVAGMVNAGRDDKRARGLFDICESTAQRVVRMMKPRTPGAARYIINRNGPGWGK